MSNRTNLSASYNYTVTAAPDNSAYLWSGHGLENAPNPTIYIRSDDNITITNASGGHIMELSADFAAWSVTESNGQIVLVSDPALFGEGKYTYVCTSHPAMTGKLIVSHVVADGGPEDGYGTGPLPETQNAIKMDAIRTKINEIVTKGGIGGGSIGVSDTPPSNPAEGDLWFDETAAALYVWIADPSNSWVQVSSAGGGSIDVSDTPPSNPAEGDLWYDETSAALYVWIDSPTNSWVQSSGAGGGSIDVSNTAPTSPAEGDLWFNTTEGQLYVYVASETAWIQTNGGGGSGGGQVYAFRGPNITSEGSYTYNYPSEWTQGLPDEVFVTTVYPSSDASSSSHIQLVSFDATSVTIYCQNYNVTAANVFANILLVKNYGGGTGGATGGASIEVSDTAPATPADGDLWFNTVQAELYVYLDAEGGWVQTNGGGAGGPRAYVAFDGTATDMSAELSGSNSLNVSSITDNGAGDYTINYTNPLVKPIITIGYEVRSSAPFHALYWGIIDQTDSYARIGLGSNNVYYDHPYISFVVH